MEEKLQIGNLPDVSLEEREAAMRHLEGWFQNHPNPDSLVALPDELTVRGLMEILRERVKSDKYGEEDLPEFIFEAVINGQRKKKK